tara:strand:+ start:102 stop:467 length:366 start_codon:yes stop_codon:yes gene_type:complete
MKISRKEIIKIIQEEKKKILNEGCGCGCKGSPGGCGGDSIEMEPLDNYIDDDYGMEVISGNSLHDDVELDSLEMIGDDQLPSDHEFLTKDEALKGVVAIAMATSCPLTRDSLLGAVQSLMV